MNTIKITDIVQFAEFMQSVLVAKSLVGESFHLKIEFEIRGKNYREIKVNCNGHRVRMDLKFHVDVYEEEAKLSNRLKYYLRKVVKEGKSQSWNNTRKYAPYQYFEFSFDSIEEFVSFYNKYLI